MQPTTADSRPGQGGPLSVARSWLVARRGSYGQHIIGQHIIGQHSVDYRSVD